MKRIALVLALSAITISAFGQGALVFNNRNTAAGIDAPIRDNAGALLSGVGYYACLLGGPTDAAAWSFESRGTLSVTTNASTGAGVVNFRTGTGAGYVSVGSAGARVLPGVAYGTSGKVQIAAWSASLGADPIAAYIAWKADTSGSALMGFSSPLVLTTSTSSTDPAVPVLVGLAPFSVAPVPEPSVIALGALGLLGALVIRRRK